MKPSSNLHRFVRSLWKGFAKFLPVPAVVGAVLAVLSIIGLFIRLGMGESISEAYTGMRPMIGKMALLLFIPSAAICALIPRKSGSPGLSGRNPVSLQAQEAQRAMDEQLLRAQEQKPQPEQKKKRTPDEIFEQTVKDGDYYRFFVTDSRNNFMVPPSRNAMPYMDYHRMSTAVNEYFRRNPQQRDFIRREILQVIKTGDLTAIETAANLTYYTLRYHSDELEQTFLNDEILEAVREGVRANLEKLNEWGNGPTSYKKMDTEVYQISAIHFL